MCGREVLRHHLKQHARARLTIAKMNSVAVLQRVTGAGFIAPEILTIDGDLEAALPHVRHEVKGVLVVVDIGKDAVR